jgi:3'(2'), 5'-bisphosphate nucleotidase
LIQEAGGEISDISGKPLDFSLGRTLKANKGIVATSAKIHSKVIEACNKHFNK